MVLLLVDDDIQQFLLDFLESLGQVHHAGLGYFKGDEKLTQH